MFVGTLPTSIGTFALRGTLINCSIFALSLLLTGALPSGRASCSAEALAVKKILGAVTCRGKPNCVAEKSDLQKIPKWQVQLRLDQQLNRRRSMHYTVNIIDIERALIDLGGEAQAKSIQDRILADHCGDAIPENYSHAKSFRQTIQRKMEDYCPQAEGFNQAKKEAKFLRVGHGLYRLAVGYQHKEFPAIEEVTADMLYTEGATRTITVNYYERNPAARVACISHYGIKCTACGFDFEAVYGELGRSFIHVHHIIPLSEVKATYAVDPIRDLRPVCANCHAIIHRSTPALAIEDVVNALNR